MARKLIGVTACVRREDRDWHAVSEPYLRAVIDGCDAIPVIVPALGDALAADALLERLDGLLFTGSPTNIEPSRYGGPEPRPTTLLDPRRDATTLPLFTRALARGTPVLAICRGMQVLNVAMGGTLVQDIPSEVTGALEHSVPQPRAHIAHEVWIAKDSKLSTLLADHMEDGETCHVNSRHHQSVKQVAKGFDVTATSPDGVIEAMESPALPFCIAVQWHPENFWRTGEFRELFQGLVQAANARQR